MIRTGDRKIRIEVISLNVENSDDKNALESFLPTNHLIHLFC